MAVRMEVQKDGNKIYSHIRDKWLILTPEEEVRQSCVCKLVNHYGYSIEQMGEEIKVNNSNRGQGKARADIVIWKSKEDKKNNKNTFIVVECKAETIKIRQEDYFQGANYAAWSGASFFITTNEKETKFFRVDKESLPKELDEIIDIPRAELINNKKEIDKLLAQTKAFSRDEFAKLLWKCHNIIRNNDKLSPEAAFDEISKILFMKIRYERNPDEDVLFSLEKFQRDEKHFEKNIKKHLPHEAQIPYMQYLFKATKDEFSEDRLFDSHEVIRIKQYSFEQIVKELERYNLSATSDDVKGIAFEEFLGTTFRGELGQFFTPRTIVDFMVEILDPQEGETICDPTCGSGGFLIKAFEYIRENIEKDVEAYKKEIKDKFFNEGFEKLTETEQEKITHKVNSILKKLNQDVDVPNKSYSKQTESEKQRRIAQLSANCIFGTDANPRMARTSKMNMIMHGDGHGGVHHHDGLINVNGIFEERFDVILTNPPFGARVDKNYKLSETDKFYDKEKIKEYKERYGDECVKRIEELNNAIDEKQTVVERFNVGKFSTLTEILFMERCLNLLKKGGRMGIVLPEGVLNNANLQKVRDYFSSRAKILLITSIPSDVFIASGAAIKPSLLFFKKLTDEEMQKKETFDYEVVMAQVEKAGITSTGAKCENELEKVAAEFKDYRVQNNLWTPNIKQISYKLQGDSLTRIVDGEAQVIND